MFLKVPAEIGGNSRWGVTATLAPALLVPTWSGRRQTLQNKLFGVFFFFCKVNVGGVIRQAILRFTASENVAEGQRAYKRGRTKKTKNARSPSLV